MFGCYLFIFFPSNSAVFPKMNYFFEVFFKYSLLLIFVLYNLKTGDALERVSGEALKRVTGDALKRVIADSLKSITVVVAHCFCMYFA